jgi:predicted phage terminase large subunit-like protein
MEAQAVKARRAEDERRQAELRASAEQIRARCSTLAGFVQEAWHVLEPRTPLVWGWHLDAVCSHLEAVVRGDINRLLINIPPGMSKSMLTSVMLQAYEWGPCGNPSKRYLTTSFNDGPVKRDTRKTRDLIMSPWFQALWPNVVLTRAGETSFANTATGTREGVAFGSLTSQRGDVLLIDDPHSTKTAESEAERNNTTRQFREGAQNRLNDQEKSAIIVIMQRLHEKDVAGQILSLGMGYTHLMLPMEYEPERACRTSIGWSDPRTDEGQLLDEARFPRPVIDQLKRDLGSYAYAGQYQQRPVPREGGMFKRQWFEGQVIKAAPAGTIWVRGWDLAATKLNASDTKGARTAGVKLGRAPNGSFIVGDARAAGEDASNVERLIKSVAEIDGVGVHIDLPQDPGQAGKVQKRALVQLLTGYNVRVTPETGDKVTRAGPVASQAEGGNLYILEGHWNEEFLNEICLFPGGARKDLVDAMSRAFGALQLIQAVGGALAGVEEITDDGPDLDHGQPKIDNADLY